jgi:integrase
MKTLTSTTPVVTLSEGFCDLLQVTEQRVRDGVRAPGTLEMQEAHARYWAAELGPELPIDEIDEFKLEQLASRPRLPPKHAARVWGPATLRKRLSTLRSMLALEHRRRRLERVPAFPLVLVPKAPTPSVIDSYRDAVRLFDSLPLHRAEWYWLALWTSQRPVNVNGMKWADVDLRARTMLVKSQKTKMPPLKVRIPQPLFDVLAQMFERDKPQPTDQVVRPWGSSRKSTLPLHCSKCGIPRMNAMALRHTSLSWIAARTGITVSLARYAGHKSTRMLEQTYAHFLPPQMRELTEALDLMAMPANDNAGGDPPK